MNGLKISWLSALIGLLLSMEVSANRFFVLPQVTTPRSDNLEADSGDLSSLNANNAKKLIRVAYQGEPGAYSEQAVRELLGPNVIAVARPNFEACYKAVACKECDYACLPVENSLGGSIHENYDLMLRYDLTIVAEHELRVSHCLHVAPGVKREDIKYCISHPQALAQCDNYLRGLGITPFPMYDTAGSAKLISDIFFTGDEKSTQTNDPKRSLPDQCTVANTAAIASVLAGKYYQLECLDRGIEDDDTNFTRFLLLARSPGVSQYLNKNIPSKTSIVFTLANTPGALYKALACFSLRDIDFSKIESRPTSASLLNYLKYKNQALGGKNKATQVELPRFRYCFYLDFLASDLDENAQNALHHLREQAEFCRILGSYPQKSRLVGPIHDAIVALNAQEAGKVHSVEDVTQRRLPSDDDDMTQLNIGIIGYGTMGQILGRRFVERNKVRCMDSADKTKEAESVGVEYFESFDMENFLKGLDVLVLSVPITDFEKIVSSLPVNMLKGKLVVEVCPLSILPKQVLLQYLGQDVDIICSTPMFGSDSSAWDGQPMIYEKVRISDERRATRFLSIFERARCQMVEMTAEQQDAHTADAEFVTHLTGRLLHGALLPATPVMSKEYAALRNVAEMASGDTFDLFFGMFKYNERARTHMNRLRDNLAKIERQLAAKDAYIAASVELRNSERQRLIAECRQLLQEVSKMEGNTTTDSSET